MVELFRIMANKINQIKLKINKLGAIRDSVCNLNQFIVISGESGLGKSYLAATCNYFFHLLSSLTRLNNIIRNNHLPTYNEMRQGWGVEGEAFTLHKSDLENWINQDIVDYLKYLFNAQSFVADIEVSLPLPDKMVFHYVKEVESIENIRNEYYYLDINQKLRYKVKNEDESIQGESNFSFLLRYFMIDVLIGSFRGFRHNFILPPSRGAVLTESVLPKSGLYSEFVNVMRELDVSQPEDFTPSTDLMSQFGKILNGTVSRTNTDNYLYTTSDNTAMPLSAAASSVRELSPLFLYVEKFDISKTAFFIEEPEAHLHPSKQRMMADILALMVNNGSFVQITTHSDYLMRRLNELINAFIISNRSNNQQREDAFNKVVSGISLNASLINAMLLVKANAGSVIIKEQSLENGFDFASFVSVLTEGLENERVLNDLMEGDSV